MKIESSNEAGSVNSSAHLALEALDNKGPAMSFRRHAAVISLLLRGAHDAASERFRSTLVRPTEFIAFVARHNLHLLLFALLDGSPVRQVLPPEWLRELKIGALRHWARQEKLLRELMRISALFAAARQDFILLKGAYLATRFFGGVDRRLFFDLDLLVERDNLTRTQVLLQSAGYTRKSTVLFNEGLTTYFTHAFDYAKDNVILDLHWALSANAAHRLNYNAIWRTRQNFVINDRSFSVLSDEYEVVFSLISIFKDIERGAARLKSFVDLYFILKALEPRLNWQTFVENRRREKILRISINVLALFLDLFDCREEFPAIVRVVVRERALVKRASSEDAASILESSPGSLQNKRWAAGVYECSRVHVFLWWLTSLPFRLAVHDPTKIPGLMRRYR